MSRFVSYNHAREQNMPFDYENGPNEQFHVNAAGRSWTIERSSDLESLWEAIAADDRPDKPRPSIGGYEPDPFDADERLPYWAEIWPASLLLCTWLEKQQQNIRGKRCMDLGCGLGLTALVACGLGARVVGMDYEWAALHFARKNISYNFPGTNSSGMPGLVQMDWRLPAFKPHQFSHVWGGDVMYEKRFIEPVHDFLDYNLAYDGVAWLAAPERKMFSPFNAHMEQKGWICRQATRDTVRHITSNGPELKANVWEFRRA